MTFAMIECFIAATETLNFTIAAQSIHITQPAFSRNIQALEEELGFSLFLRSKQNGLRITPAGLELYNGIKKIKQDFELVLEKAERINRGEEGQLVIGVINGVCIDSMTMNALHMFQERYPQVDMKVIGYSFRDLLKSVETGESDMVFSVGNAVKGREDLLHEEIFEIDNYLAVPSRLKCDVEREYSLKEFEDEYFLLSEDAPELNELFIQECRKLGFEPKTKMAPDYETKMLWVGLEQGVAINSKEHYMKNSSYVDFVKIKEVGKETYTIIWSKDNYNPAIALFYSMFGTNMTS